MTHYVKAIIVVVVVVEGGWRGRRRADAELMAKHSTCRNIEMDRCKIDFAVATSISSSGGSFVNVRE